MEKQAKRIFYCLVSSLLLNVSLILVIGLEKQEARSKEQKAKEYTQEDYSLSYSKGYARALILSKQFYYENLKVIELSLKNNKNIPWREIYENYR